MKKHITQDTINRFHVCAKGTEDIVIIEGLHALKHAIFFGAEISVIYTVDFEQAVRFMQKFGSPHAQSFFQENAVTISPEELASLSHNSIRTGTIALAKKGKSTLEDLDRMDMRPAVVLEDPRDVANVGAVARVSAARGVSGLIVTGSLNPWHARAIRGGAGLQWAMPTIHAQIESVFEIYKDRRILACSDEGQSIYDVEVGVATVYIFGTEREGVQLTTKQQSSHTISIPMQKGVSSMNLATSVSAILFSHK